MFSAACESRIPGMAWQGKSTPQILLAEPSPAVLDRKVERS
jgi:hypothetical protein